VCARFAARWRSRPLARVYVRRKWNEHRRTHLGLEPEVRELASAQLVGMGRLALLLFDLDQKLHETAAGNQRARR
jgi:hypothetical protein